MKTHCAKRSRLPLFATAALTFAILALTRGPLHAGPPSRNDFGYQRILINGHAASGNRPLLVILATFPGGPSFGNTATYDDVVFQFGSTRSVVSYYLETSNNHFSWTRASAGPITLNLTATDRWVNFPNDSAYVANLVTKVMGSIDFQQFDNDSNGTITGDELGILIFHNEDPQNGYIRAITRGVSVVRVAGPPVNFHGLVSLANFTLATGDFASIVHELTHLAGSVDGDDTKDLYGWDCMNQNLTLMGCTGSDGNTVHHDSCYKLHFGWVDPRIRSLAAGGIESIPAAQMGQDDAPILLYDPAHGLKEFFMLEYRTRTSPKGGGFDSNVPGDGLVIWHIVHDKDNNAATIPTRAAGPSGQTGWKSCTKCSGMFYTGFNLDPLPTAQSYCPQGGAHSAAPAFYCIEMNNPSPTGQVEWRWCSKCQGLFYGLNQAASRCPAGGAHDGSSSANYSVRFNTTLSSGEPGWFWCRKCQGAFAGGANTSAGRCPASGSHDGSTSLNYTMHLWENGEFTRGAPDLSRGNNTVWGSGTITPSLSWLDGAALPVRIFVRPFSSGDPAITVEWRRESGVSQNGPNFVVNTADDHDDGLPGVSDCTLREAINAANQYPGDHTITFASTVTGLITLTGGELTIGKTLDIIGPGAKILTISGNNSRVFHITSGSVILSGLTLSNSGAIDGCVRSEASDNLTVASCTFSGNRSSGILNYGTLLVNDSTFSGNTAAPTLRSGGGIYNSSGAVATIQNSTLAGNFAQAGGGIANFGTLNLLHCTLSDNTATCCDPLSQIGGGIYNSGGAVRINNSIIAGNSAASNGSDVFGAFTSTGYNLIGSTDGSSGFSNGVNHDQTGCGGTPINPMLGPLRDNGGPTFTMSLLPGSPAIDQGGQSGCSADQRGRHRPFDDPTVSNASGGSDVGAVEVGHFVVSNTNDSGAGSLRGAILSAMSADSITFAPAVLGSITLITGELAINQNLTITGPGANFLGVSGNNSSRVFNIGPAIVSLSGLSVRNGFVAAADCAEGAGIYNAGVLSITACAVMDNAVRGFEGADGLDDEAAGFNGGDGGCARGAGIYNANILHATDCTLSGNSAIGGLGGNGGNADGSLVISVGGRGGAGGGAEGGGVYGLILTSTLVNCTVVSNFVAAGSGGSGGSADPAATQSAGGRGGNSGAGDSGGVGILSASTLQGCTIVGNTAAGNTGGLGGSGRTRGARGVNRFSYGGGVSSGLPSSAVRNTLIAGNTAVNGPDCAGSYSSLGYNLIGATDGSSGFGSAGDQLGSSAAPLNPVLGPLQINGGPTLTMALLAGSPAIDKGGGGGFATDQRGRHRPYDDAALANATGGDGTDIGAFEVSPVVLLLRAPVRSTNNLFISFSSEVGQRYRIERKDTLAPGAWTTVADHIIGTGGIVPVIDLGAATQPRRFYRGQVLP